MTLPRRYSQLLTYGDDRHLQHLRPSVPAEHWHTELSWVISSQRAGQTRRCFPAEELALGQVVRPARRFRMAPTGGSRRDRDRRLFKRGNPTYDWQSRRTFVRGYVASDAPNGTHVG